MTGYFLKKPVIIRRMKKVHVKEMVLLLKKKVRYLREFQSLNQEEWMRINQGQLNNIEAFYYDRELLLNAMDRVDKKLKNYNIDQCEDVGVKEKQKIISLLKEKRQAIHNILNQDMKMHNLLYSSFYLTEKDKSA